MNYQINKRYYQGSVLIKVEDIQGNNVKLYNVDDWVSATVLDLIGFQELNIDDG